MRAPLAYIAMETVTIIFELIWGSIVMGADDYGEGAKQAYFKLQAYRWVFMALWNGYVFYRFKQYHDYAVNNNFP